jgi:acetoin utilization protein AcuB
MYQPIHVYDVMTSPVVTAPPHLSLPRLKQMMTDQHVHRLPIIDRGRLIGIVTLGDLRNAFPSDVLPSSRDQHRQLNAIRAADIMRTDVFTIAPDATLEDATRTMLQHCVSGLPVLDGDELVGMITRHDVCRLLVVGRLQPASAPGASQMPANWRENFLRRSRTTPLFAASASG